MTLHFASVGLLSAQRPSSSSASRPMKTKKTP
jgi:hypothetical protein